MADAIAVLGLEVDATGALSNLKKFETATQRTGATAATAGAQVDKMSAALQAQERMMRAAAESNVRSTIATQAAVRAQVEQIAAVEASRAAVVRKDAALVNDAITSGNAANAAKMLAASWAAEATAANGATAAIARHTAATIAGSAASTSAAAGAGLLARGMAAVGGPAGVALIAVTGLQIAMQLYDSAAKKTEKAAADQAKAFEKLSDSAKVAALSMELARLEAERANAARTIQTAPQTGNLFGVLGAERELERIGPLMNAATREITKLRSETNAAAHSLTGAFAQSIADVNGELAAFNRGGATAANAYKLAAAEWNRSAHAITNLSAALKAHDPDAQRLMQSATELAQRQATLTARTREAANAIREQTRAEREAEAARRAAAATLANSDKAVAGVTDGFTEARERDLAMLDKQRELQAKIAEIEAKRATVVNQIADGISDQFALIGRTKREQELLIDAARELELVEKGATLERAQAIVKQQRAIENANAAAVTWVNTLQTAVGVVQALASGLDRAAVAQAALGAQSVLTGIEKSKTATSFTGKLGAAGAIAGGVLAIADALDLFGSKAAERARQMQEAANRFGVAMDSFADTANGGATDVVRAIKRQNDEFLAVLEAFRAKYAEIGRKGFTGSSLQELNAIYETQKKAVANITGSFLSGLGNDLLSAQGNAEQVRLNEAQEKYRTTLQQINDLVKFGAISQDDYASALANANEILKLTTQQIRDLAAAEAARKAETERRSTFDLVNGAQSFTDSRGASQAAFDENQRRRLADASDKAAAELFNLAEAADRAARIAEQDLSTQRGLQTRIAQALGDVRGAEDLSRTQRNADELSAAIRDGMAPTNFALLKIAQFSEASQIQMQRAIEDGTKAIQARAANEIAANNLLIEAIRSTSAMEIARIDDQIKSTQDAAKATAQRFDEQIDAIREQTRAQVEALDAQIDSARQALDAAKLQQSTLEKSVATQQRVVESLSAFLDGQRLGDTSSLSPERKLAEARRQFDALAAQGGPEAALGLPAAANALLQASRAFNGSGVGFVNEEQRIRQIVEAARAQFGATLPTDLQALEAARAAVAGIERQIDQLGAQKDVIERTSAKEIEALQRAKEKAATDSARQIEMLQQLKQTAQDNATREIEKLQTLNDSIQAAAQRQVDALIASEQAAHQDRVRQYDATQQIVTLLGGPAATVTSGPSLRGRPSDAPKANTVPQDTLQELKGLRAVVTQQGEMIAALLERNGNIALAANDEEVQALAGVAQSVQSLAGEVRQGAQLNATRTSNQRMSR